MNPYRLKHKPSGLYYQPIKGGSNLGTRGKVYLTDANGLTGQRDPMLISVQNNSLAYKKSKDILPWEKSTCFYERMICYVPHSDFEKEFINE